MLNKKDLLILSHFRQNARKSLTNISRKTGVPVSTIFDKLKLYEEKLIQRHTALLDFQKLGYEIRVKMTIKANREKRDDLINYLIRHKSVNSIFRINNGGDVLIEGIFRNMKELQEFSESLEDFDIKNKQEFFVLEDIKREAFMSDPDIVRLIGPV